MKIFTVWLKLIFSVLFLEAMDLFSKIISRVWRWFVLCPCVFIPEEGILEQQCDRSLDNRVVHCSTCKRQQGLGNTLKHTDTAPLTALMRRVSSLVKTGVEINAVLLYIYPLFIYQLGIVISWSRGIFCEECRRSNKENKNIISIPGGRNTVVRLLFVFQ